MGFTIVFNIGDIYYQQQLLEKEVIRDYTKHSPSYIWISLHLILSLTILFFAASIKLTYDNMNHNVERRLTENNTHATDDGEGDSSDSKERLLMCLTASFTLIIIFLLRMRYKGILYQENDSFRRLSYIFRSLLYSLLFSFLFYFYFFLQIYFYHRFTISIFCAFIPLFVSNTTTTICLLFLCTCSLVVQVFLFFYFIF